MHMTNSKSKGRDADVYAPLRSQRQHFEEVLKDIDKKLKVRKTHVVFKKKRRLMCKKIRKLSNPSIPYTSRSVAKHCYFCNNYSRYSNLR